MNMDRLTPREHAIGWALLALWAVLVFAFIFFATLFVTQPSLADGRYILQWRFVTYNGSGPVAGVTPERQTFHDAKDCAAFGTLNIARMQDWVRGLIRAEWSHPVSVAFDCKPAGDPV